ncbi:MAG: CRISPR-associated endonuclease Cas2 [Succinivibrio sp.]
MSIYTKYLVCYDIENDKTRKKVHTFLKDIGLIPLQYSVFYGALNRAEVTAMRLKLKELIKIKSDKCLWVQCTLEDQKISDCIGYLDFSFTEPDGYETI